MLKIVLKNAEQLPKHTVLGEEARGQRPQPAEVVFFTETLGPVL